MPPPDRTRSAEIFLIEDNPQDVRLMREAFRELGMRHQLIVAESGAEALHALHVLRGREPARRPDFVLLDLNLPDMHGLEVLGAIKGDPALRRVPVVVFSSSQNRDEITQAYNLNANSYIAKPVELEDFIRVLKGVEEFWLTVVKLPKE